jgi:hypothetical protein
MTSNGGRSTSSGFPNCPRPQLPVSHFLQLQLSTDSYITIDGQSASLSSNKAPIWGLRPEFYYCQTTAGLLMWGARSHERTGLSFTIAAGPRQRSHSRVRVCGTRYHTCILLSQIPDFYFVASHGSQGYDDGIRPHIHTGQHSTENVSSIIACSLVAGATTCPQRCSLATAVVLSPVYIAVTWQWVYMSQYYTLQHVSAFSAIIRLYMFLHSPLFCCHFLPTLANVYN